MNSSLAVTARVAPITPQDSLHRRLAYFNRKRLTPALPTSEWLEELQQQGHFAQLEGRFLEGERRAVIERCAGLPQDPDDFMQWFESLDEAGAGQHDPLFNWLATRASMEDMRWFLNQEIAGEAGFDDLVALTQVRMPTQAKLEMARNYWDEMGRGREIRMHGPMLHATAVALELRADVEATVWEALALANLMSAMASSRRYAYHSIGALGVVELTAPSRVRQVDKGLKRLGVAPRARSYFTLHSRIDVLHSREWNREVIRPLIEADPRLRIPIAEGALMRLNAGARCFARYRETLWGSPTLAPRIVRPVTRERVSRIRSAPATVE
ncbi:heme oxygenase-like protein [Panacagrimonas perspica]|uniref:Heme oxygenase-like protein n=1 Tax=Panacagrimonas perspica TaxID=381431 RepID=A0A4R7P3S1_9GAMM|nr:iron-containing redox enzyme family protein [Panacagrimonas perspica]TDU28258.1 heme oxygenase-like protein [Panacagrimonas perspica]